MQYLIAIPLIHYGIHSNAQERRDVVFVFNKNDTTNVIEKKDHSKLVFLLNNNNLSFVHNPEKEIKTVSYDSITNNIMSLKEYNQLGPNQRKKLIEENNFFLFVRDKSKNNSGCLYKVEYAITIRDPIFD